MKRFDRLRESVKLFIPRPVRDLLRRRPLVSLQLMSWHWSRIWGVPKAKPVAPINSLLIVPPDTYSVMGSRGDDAMVSVVVQQALKINPACRIGIVSVSPEGSPGIKRLSLTAEPVWEGSGFSRYVAAMKQYDAVAVIGADVMDGHYYSAGSALRYWLMADLASRAGIPAVVLGFSFEHPSIVLKGALNNIHPDVKICLRDAGSLRCFSEFCSARGEGVSDIAFLLEPAAQGAGYADSAKWIADQRQSGKLVCAINLRPMHYPAADGGERVVDLSGVLASVLAEIGEEEKIAYLLLPHDFRAGEQSDLNSLTAVSADLKTKGTPHYMLYDEVPAVELKAIVSQADILLTGRMHLAIAAVSMGVPLASISFQEKFKGFYDLFEIPHEHLIHPEAASDRTALKRFLLDAIRNRIPVAKKIKSNIADVVKLSKKNFEVLQ